MCAQCMASAATVAAGATGLRAWLAASAFSWMTPVRLKRVTVALLAVAFAIAAVGIG
jgi:hypothetical protein